MPLIYNYVINNIYTYIRGRASMLHHGSWPQPWHLNRVSTKAAHCLVFYCKYPLTTVGIGNHTGQKLNFNILMILFYCFIAVCLPLHCFATQIQCTVKGDILQSVDIRVVWVISTDRKILLLRQYWTWKGVCQWKDAHRVSSVYIWEAVNNLQLGEEQFTQHCSSTYRDQAALHYAWLKLNPVKMFLNKCSYIWNAGKPRVNVSSVRIYCRASGRQAYLQEGWVWQWTWKVHNTCTTQQYCMCVCAVPSLDQGTHMLDGQSNHSARIHNIQKQVKSLILHQRHDSQHHHQPPSTRHQVALPGETAWKDN